MKNFTYLEIRSKYLKHLTDRGHTEIPSASVVPENDPSVLFVNAGMFPLVPYLLGEKHPSGTKLVNAQRCIRTGDIDEVGDNSHCTSFEMLGNWSLNEYFKKEAIEITMSFLVDVLEIDPKDIYGSAFEGNSDAPRDDVSIQAWTEIFKKYGIDAKVGKGEKIQLFGKKCWWELETGGPCGPCSEIFYNTGKEPCGPDCNVNCDCGKFLEMGNNVFMEYLKKDGKYSPLGRHNVDFGGGLDRYATVSQGKTNYFETDIYKPILDKVVSLSKNSIEKSQRIIVDHIKAATWIVADGVVPGRNGREYILRRLIRRAVRHGRSLGISPMFTKEIADIAITQFGTVHPLLIEKKEYILSTIEEEEKKFNQTLENGLKEFERVFRENTNFNNENGETFKLYETYGFPLEMTLEELRNREIAFDQSVVEQNHTKAMQAHQEKSRSASAGMFKGGLADISDITVKYHTATHLLLRALYDVLGTHVYQKGCNITPERIRLDFPNDTKLTEQQIKQVEDMVNINIEAKLPVTFVEMKKEDALKIVKYAAFTDKYPDTVKVYYIGDINNPASVEICGGPHVSNTSELGHFKILKEESVSAGVRRIKGVLE